VEVRLRGEGGEGGGRYSPLLSSIAERRDCVLQVCVFKRGI